MKCYSLIIAMSVLIALSLPAMATTFYGGDVGSTIDVDAAGYSPSVVTALSAASSPSYASLPYYSGGSASGYYIDAVYPPAYYSYSPGYSYYPSLYYSYPYSLYGGYSGYYPVYAGSYYSYYPYYQSLHNTIYISYAERGPSYYARISYYSHTPDVPADPPEGVPVNPPANVPAGPPAVVSANPPANPSVGTEPVQEAVVRPGSIMARLKR